VLFIKIYFTRSLGLTNNSAEIFSIGIIWPIYIFNIGHSLINVNSSCKCNSYSE